MTMIDYGRRKRRKLNGPVIGALAAGGLACAAVVGFFVVHAMQHGRQEKAASDYFRHPPGTPCKLLSAADFAALHLTLEPPLAVGKVSFGRAYGEADCQEFPADAGLDSFGVCQLSSPYSVAVTTDKGVTTYFAVPIGRAATASTEGGKASCVVMTTTPAE